MPDASVDSPKGEGPVAKTFRANNEKFAFCARDSVTVQTGSTQNIRLLFTVTPDGSVEKTEIDDMTAPDPELRACVLHHLRAMRFPKPKDGKPKRLAYPLVFKARE